MRRLPLFFVPFLLAACGAGSTDPDEPVPLGPAQVWEGTARYTRTLTSGGSLDIAAFSGNVRWQTTDRGAPPYGYTVVSGTMAVVHRKDLPGGCTVAGQKEFTLGPGDGSFIIFSGSRVSGTIRKAVTFTSTLSCQGGGGFEYPDEADIQLQIEGTQADGRISGTMTPAPTADSRIEGSWDFAPVE